MRLALSEVRTKRNRPPFVCAALKASLRGITQVRFTETKSTFLHFLTSVCAIVGGVFTVSVRKAGLNICATGLVYCRARVMRASQRNLPERAHCFASQGIVDAFVYHGHKALKKKMELGKLS